MNDNRPTGIAPFRPLSRAWLASLLPNPIIVVAALLVVAGSLLWLPAGGRDWSHDIAPAARLWWSAPWLHGLPQMPWAALLFSPLALLPAGVGGAILNGFSVVGLALVIRAAGGKDWMAIPILISPFGYWLFANGQTDVFILVGLLFFNGFDLIWLMIKPQVAFGVIVPRLRRAGPRWPIYLAPLGVMLLVSLLVWPNWPLGIISYAPVLLPATWNWALWPYGLLLGLPLLWRAWQTGDDRLGVAATPLLFPYVNPPSYLGLVGMFAAWRPRWALFGCLMTWALAGTFFILKTAAWPGFELLVWLPAVVISFWLIGPDMKKGLAMAAGFLESKRRPKMSRSGDI